MGDHRDVAGRDLDGGGAHAGGELPLGIRREGLVVGGDQVPGRPRLPGRDAHRVPEGGHGQRLLHGVHHPGLHRVHVGGEVIDEVVLGQPAEAVRIGEQVRQRRGHWSLRQQPAQRFTLVKAERGDVDQSGDVRGVRAQGGHDLAAVGVPGDDGGAVLEVQDLAQPGHVIGQRGQRELRCRDMVAVGLQALDDAAPARALGPCAVDENDIRSGVHLCGPFVVRSYCHLAARGRRRGIRSTTALRMPIARRGDTAGLAGRERAARLRSDRDTQPAGRPPARRDYAAAADDRELEAKARAGPGIG